MSMAFKKLAGASVIAFMAASLHALTWNGGASGTWNGSASNWLDDDSQSTSWTDGADAKFAGPAAVTVGEAVSAGALTFNGGAVSLAGESETRTYADSFLQTNSAVLFPNASLASVTGISGLMADAAKKGYIQGQQPATAYWVKNDGTTLTAQLQHFSLTEHYTKCVVIELTQQGADIAGRALYATYYSVKGADGKDIRDLDVRGEDLSRTGVGTSGKLSINSTTPGYGIDSLTLVFDNPVTLTPPAVLATTNDAVATIAAPLIVPTSPGFADGVTNTYAPFLTKTPVKIIENARLDDVKRLRGKLGGSHITTYWNDKKELYADSYHLRRPDDNTLTVQLQSWSDRETYTKCVRVALTQVGEDIYACVTNAYALLPRYTNDLGHDFESADTNNLTCALAESGSAEGYGVYDLEVVMKGEETIVPQNLAVNGDTVHRYAGFLPRDSTKLFENLSLDDVVCLGANFGGDYINTYKYDKALLPAHPYYVKRVGDTLTMQLQVYSPREEYTKAISIELTQEGPDIYGRAVAAYCYTVAKKLDMRGIDFETYPNVTSANCAHSGAENGYGAYELCLVSTNAGRVDVRGPLIQPGDLGLDGTLQLGEGSSINGLDYSGAVVNNGVLLLKGAGYCVFRGPISGTGAIVVDGLDVDFSGKATYTGGLSVRNGRVRITENNALPFSGPIEIGAGGNLVLCPYGHPGSPGYVYTFANASMGGTNPVFVAKGGTLTLGEADKEAWFVTGTQGGRRFIVDGGTIHTQAKMVHNTNRKYYHQNYLANLELKNGAVVRGTPFHAGNNQDLEIRSSGEGTNVVSSGFWMVQGNSKISLNVLDGTLDISGEIFDHPDHPGQPINKTGDGLLLFSHANCYTGGTVVARGMLRATVDNALPDRSDIVLAGGALDVGATSNCVEKLVVAADSALNVAGCDLAFADSSAVAWTNGAVVTVTGDLKHSKVRFGTDANGLTTAQLTALRYENRRVVIDAAGYIHPVPAGTIVVIR